MFERSIKSALLVDFDNILGLMGKEIVERIPNWLAWIEDGQFDTKRRIRRRLLQKRVYWNSPHEIFRKPFEQAGFVAVLCPSRVRTGKSAADMMIALDAFESSYESRSIKEYIVLTTDTDFVPLLERLAERSKMTVAGANEKSLSMSVYSDHADLVIPSFALREAFSYQRPAPRGSLFRMFEAKPSRPQTKEVAKPQPATPKDEPKAPLKPAAAAEFDLPAAAIHLFELCEDTPGVPIGRQSVVRGMTKRVPGFKVDGARPYLGCGNYTAMIERLAQLHDQLQIHTYPNGGKAIVCRPVEAPAQDSEGNGSPAPAQPAHALAGEPVKP